MRAGDSIGVLVERLFDVDSNTESYTRGGNKGSMANALRTVILA